jgi:lysophospholipase
MTSPDPASPPAPPASFDRRAIPADADIETWKAPDGWPLRAIRWGAPDGPPRGSLLMLGGRGDHLEKYLETLEDFRLRGWCVESVDWRGQGGSGRLADDPHVGHVTDFAVWIADLAAYVAEWRQRTPGPHVIIGHSMGGHLLLRALAEGAVTPDAAVLVAPMLGFTAPYPDWLGDKVARLMTRLGDPARAAWRVSEKPGSSLNVRQKLLTHDADRYADELWWHAHAPETLLGPASWQWVAAAYASFLHLARPGVLERVTVPMLILAAENDGLVSVKAIRRDAARLPHAQLHVYGPEAAHELLRETDRLRNDVLSRIDAFLNEVVGRT